MLHPAYCVLVVIVRNVGDNEQPRHNPGECAYRDNHDISPCCFGILPYTSHYIHA